MDQELIKDLANGCTVYGRKEAQEIRALQKEHPDWVDVIDNMKKLEYILGEKLDGTKTMPYFGAILTREGIKELMEPKKG